MRDAARDNDYRVLDFETRARLIQQMEKEITEEISDRDYRGDFVPSLSVDVAIKHWR